MVVNRHDGVVVVFCQGANHVCHALLHFGVGALHGVKFNGIVILPGVDARHSAAAHADAVVVTTHQHHFFTGFRRSLNGIALVSKPYAAGKHNHLVVCQLAFGFFVFEGEERAADEGLTEFVTEIAGTIGGFDEDFFRRLVKPWAWRHGAAFPSTLSFSARVTGHIHCRACQWQTGTSAAQSVADFAARTGGCAIEGLHGGGEVVGFGFQRNHRIYFFHFKIVGLFRVNGCKLVDGWSVHKCHIIFICRNHLVRIVFCGLFDEAKQAGGHFFAIDDEGATENFVATVLAIHLRKAKHLAVGERASQAVA